MWNPDHRTACDRRGLRYPSDLTDAEWALVAPLIPPAKRGGRPRSVNLREVLNAIFYVLWTGCQWTALPTDLPPRSTVWDYLDLWDWDGTLERIHRKRHVLTDTLGLLLGVVVHPANVQDRDGAEALLREARRSFPFLERIIGDAGYQGRKMEAAVARTGKWQLEIIRRCDRHRFVVLPKRWIVERTLAWISRCRRLARDYERHARKAAAFIRLAMIRLMLRRVASSR